LRDEMWATFMRVQIPSWGSAKTLNTIHGAHERNLNYAQLELGGCSGSD